MAVSKKRTSISKKHIRKNFLEKKGYWAALKAFSIAKSLYFGNSTLFIEKNKKNLRRIRTIEIRTIEVGLTQKNLITNWNNDASYSKQTKTILL